MVAAGQDPKRVDWLRERLAEIRGRIDEACRRAGRDPAGVRIVGVTKYVDAESAACLLAAGCVDLGESRPQSLWEKAAALETQGMQPRWHLVGHLQRNKLRRTLPLLDLLHTLDSERLLAAAAEEAQRVGRPLQALVEVNLAGLPGRSGVAPEDVAGLVAAAAGGPVHVRGLMGMASRPDADAGSAADPRREFAILRECLAAVRREVDDPASLVELSMGMSGDFEAAVLEGATTVRIGSLLWEGWESPPGTA